MSKPKHILLAEDDADDRDLFLEAIALIDSGIKVHTVENGEKLMDYLVRVTEYPDCIFLDLNMPKKNGADCLKEIRENERMQRIPVVIYTTSISVKDVDETYRRGASCFIRKPGTFQELRDLLARCLSYSFGNSALQRIKSDFVLNPGLV